MTSSRDPWITSGMKEYNAAFEPRMRAFLTALVQDKAAHSRFLNMLSMLEHMGSRKIMISQMSGKLDQDTLKHLAEEARHAYFFKRQAERIAGNKLDGYEDDNTMLRIPAALYFGRLDAGISAQVPPQSAYPWVSMIIELRACWLYHTYHAVLQEAGVSLSLKSILAEEDMHLAEMFELCGHDENKLRELTRYETGLFSKFFEKLEAQIETLAVKAA